ncbi:hypothetical protein FOCC_FOCC013511 [Frankliniella occidentalis]|nr:hypothetical protein FOCC_FOCC013511 [Frankliniella occidentalis]
MANDLCEVNDGADGHVRGDGDAHHEDDDSGGLGQRHHGVHDGVHDPGGRVGAEQVHGQGGRGVGEAVEQARDPEGRDVLEVVHIRPDQGLIKSSGVTQADPCGVDSTNQGATRQLSHICVDAAPPSSPDLAVHAQSDKRVHPFEETCVFNVLPPCYSAGCAQPDHVEPMRSCGL